MNRARRFDWRGWRSAIAERIDRRTIIAALAFAAFIIAFASLTLPGKALDAQRFIRNVAMVFTELTVMLLAMTVAMVAVARGTSRWLAYAIAGSIAALTFAAAGLVLDPLNFLFKMNSPRWVALSYTLGLIMWAVPAVVYVIQSNAVQNANALRRLETERTAEAERLAHQRLQAQLATIDHDLVVTALRLARASPKRAESLLAALSAYLRAAQQRESTDATAVATTLAELRAMCTSLAGGSAEEVAA
jgi:hypothetical protein